MIKTKLNPADSVLEKERKRIIGTFTGNSTGPTIVFFAGIHGNEPAGVLALDQVFDQLRDHQGASISGNLIGVAGNLGSLARNVRFVKEDLNRMWTAERLLKIHNMAPKELRFEEGEMKMLYELLVQILEDFSPPFYFIDIHTTSGETTPFVVLNDSLLNRRFVMYYPLPKILGIEEYLSGPLLSYINELGYVAFGFECGQHQDPIAVKNAIGFIWHTLSLTGFLKPREWENFQANTEIVKSSWVKPSFYEIRYQHLIEKGKAFHMFPGFENFQKVPKGEAIASYDNVMVSTKKNRRIFMPLYQDKGEEGFYFIKEVPLFFLWLSKVFRKLKVDRILIFLPGIKWQSPKRNTLLVNKKIARFMAKPLFHLLGYRTRELGEAQLLLKNRETTSKDVEYQRENWFRS